MNRKIRRITQGGLAINTLMEKLDTSVIYKVVSERGLVWYAVATASDKAEEFDTELQARMVAA